MELLDTFKDAGLSRRLLTAIRSCSHPVSIMEVCGTHTVEIFRKGIRDGLPSNIHLISGPGCPVCVTTVPVIEKAMGLALKSDTVLFCFGDMIRVPGITGNLETIRAEHGASVKIMYGPLEALKYAQVHRNKKIILLGVGFETTIPLFASVLLRALSDGIQNVFLLPAFKLVPPAIKLLLSSGDVKVDGFILPGHVSSIIGEEAYQFIVREYNIPGVIAGFETVDILSGIHVLLNMIKNKESKIKNEYSRFVAPGGNKKALEAIYRVFKPVDDEWRGLGTIPQSGLALREEFKRFDAHQFIDFDITEVKEPQGCRCGEVIKGAITPPDCELYKKKCTPESPIGPCMVSAEGTCAAYYKYGTN